MKCPCCGANIYRNYLDIFECEYCGYWTNTVGEGRDLLRNTYATIGWKMRFVSKVLQ